jgi:Tfp pilus assembly protein PilV
MTLLEVLVACGVLMFALAGIAAILPAASSLLATATTEDRAVSAGANAYAELMARDIIAASAFPALTGTSAPFFGGALVIGAPMFNALTAASNDTTRGSENIASLFQAHADRNYWPVSSSRGFFSEDDVQITTGTASAPQSRYSLMITSTSGTITPYGPREFRPGAAWGALLLSNTLVTGSGARPAVGTPAILSIASFTKPSDGSAGDAVVLNMQQRDPLFVTGTGNPNAFRPYVSTYLKPGSWVLLIPPPPLNPPTIPVLPRWTRINSAWFVRDQGVFISFSEPYSRLLPHMPGQELYAVAFKNLVKVDLYPVILR